jgi:LacI family transcriptional regulator
MSIAYRAAESLAGNSSQCSARIAVLVMEEMDYCRRTLFGVMDYALEHPELDVENPGSMRDAAAAAWLRRNKPDGAVVFLSMSHLAAALDSLAIPWCQMGEGAVSGHSVVTLDNHAVGRLAGEFLGSQGWRTVAYAGPPDENRASGLRHKGMAGAAREAGTEVSRVPPRLTSGPLAGHGSGHDQLANWLARAAKPLGIYCFNDIVAREICAICHSYGIEIPRQVGVLGTGNGPTSTRLTVPRLSSVEIPAERIGYLAIRDVHARLVGDVEGPRSIRLAPTGVVERASTDLASCEDPDVARALEYLRRNLSRPIQVQDVHEHVGCGARSLDYRFRRIVGAGIKAELDRLRFERARELLFSSKLSITAVASACGFSSVQHFSKSFSGRVGCSPRRYRQSLSAESASDHHGLGST